MRDIKWTGALAVCIRHQYIGALFEWKIVEVEDTSIVILHCTTQDRTTHKELCRNHSKIYGIEDDRCLSHPSFLHKKKCLPSKFVGYFSTIEAPTLGGERLSK